MAACNQLYCTASPWSLPVSTYCAELIEVATATALFCESPSFRPASNSGVGGNTIITLSADNKNALVESRLKRERRLELHEAPLDPAEGALAMARRVT